MTQKKPSLRIKELAETFSGKDWTDNFNVSDAVRAITSFLDEQALAQGEKNCCCLSSERGVFPCLCNCHTPHQEHECNKDCWEEHYFDKWEENIKAEISEEHEPEKIVFSDKGSFGDPILTYNETTKELIISLKELMASQKKKAVEIGDILKIDCQHCKEGGDRYKCINASHNEAITKFQDKLKKEL